MGRTGEVETLVAALQAALKPGGGALLSAVQGMGGVGKTELAYVAAQRVRDAFPDAQIVLHLRGSSANPLTAEQALQTVILPSRPTWSCRTNWSYCRHPTPRSCTSGVC